MRIAVACCGLGHVRRGVEVWAAELAGALHTAGVPVTLFKGGGIAEKPFEVVIPCVHRGQGLARLMAGWRSPGAWRTPLSSPYALESWTFTRNLIPHLRNGYDVVNLQDPLVAQKLLRARKNGRIGAEVLFANGTEETTEFLAQFDYLQELDPAGIEQLEAAGCPRKHWYVVPNFVVTDVFRPGDRFAARRHFGFADSDYVVLAVGAIQRQLKRTDYIIHEFARFAEGGAGSSVLVVAGARTEESDGLHAMARREIGDRFRFLENMPHGEMPELYRAADVFVFPVLHGIYGIALAEAAATGLPCVVHDWKRVKWVAGPKAVVVDMNRENVLAEPLQRLRDKAVRDEIAGPTRQWAEETLSVKTVIPQYIRMYEDVIGKR